MAELQGNQCATGLKAMNQRPGHLSTSLIAFNKVRETNDFIFITGLRIRCAGDVCTAFSNATWTLQQP